MWAIRKWEAGETTHYGKTHRESRLYSETISKLWSKIYRYRWKNTSRRNEPKSIKTSEAAVITVLQEGREGWCGWLAASERQSRRLWGWYYAF